MRPAGSSGSDEKPRVAGEEFRADLSWLVRLRWAALAGQVLTIAIAHELLEVKLPVAALLLVVATQAAVNVLSALWMPLSPGRLALGFAFDILALSALLALSGGPHNPFSFVYLVHLSLASMVLPQRLAWPLCGLAAVCSASLFVVPIFPLAPEHDHDGRFMALHLYGMWVAFTVAAAFIVYFVMRIRGALSARERELARAKAEAQRNERLSALTTLAAGAAHELATPLGTIATIAKEMERSLARASPSNAGQRDRLLQDARLLRAEVERCRAILQQMTAGFGASRADQPVVFSPGGLIAAALAELPPDARARIHVEDGATGEVQIAGPRMPLVSALKNLVSNALDATRDRPVSAGAFPVQVVCRTEAGQVEFDVIDRGAGIPATILSRIGEPFFTTKTVGNGMGLGFFVARSVARELGGDVAIVSTGSGGTVVRLTLPSTPGQVWPGLAGRSPRENLVEAPS